MAKKLSKASFQKLRQQNLNQTSVGVSIDVPLSTSLTETQASPDNTVCTDLPSTSSQNDSTSLPTKGDGVNNLEKSVYEDDLSFVYHKYSFEPATSVTTTVNFKVDRYIRYWLSVLIKHQKAIGVELRVKHFVYESVLLYLNSHYIISENGSCQLKDGSLPLMDYLKKNPSFTEQFGWVPSIDRNCTVAVTCSEKIEALLDNIRFKYAYCKKHIFYDALVEALNKYFLEFRPTF